MYPYVCCSPFAWPLSPPISSSVCRPATRSINPHATPCTCFSFNQSYVCCQPFSMFVRPSDSLPVFPAYPPARYSVRPSDIPPSRPSVRTSADSLLAYPHANQSFRQPSSLIQLADMCGHMNLLQIQWRFCPNSRFQLGGLYPVIIFGGYFPKCTLWYVALQLGSGDCCPLQNTVCICLQRNDMIPSRIEPRKPNVFSKVSVRMSWSTVSKIEQTKKCHISLSEAHDMSETNLKR